MEKLDRLLVALRVALGLPQAFELREEVPLALLQSMPVFGAV